MGRITKIPCESTATMESVAICDIDGDQQNDVVLLSYGPTSGLFTFDVAVVTGDGIYDTIFNTKFQVIGFAYKDGQIVIEGVDYDLERHFYDIVLEKHEDVTVVMLYDAGKPLKVWGRPNTRNLALLQDDR